MCRIGGLFTCQIQSCDSRGGPTLKGAAVTWRVGACPRAIYSSAMPCMLLWQQETCATNLLFIENWVYLLNRCILSFSIRYQLITVKKFSVTHHHHQVLKKCHPASVSEQSPRQGWASRSSRPTKEPYQRLHSGTTGVSIDSSPAAASSSISRHQ